MILTRKRLLVDIFLTLRLSKSLAFCEFTSVNFKPWYFRKHLLYLKVDDQQEEVRVIEIIFLSQQY